ncbi:MAG: hypothetical protein ACRCYU_04255 [Nocardioides sp.]
MSEFIILNVDEADANRPVATVMPLNEGAGGSMHSLILLDPWLPGADLPAVASIEVDGDEGILESTSPILGAKVSVRGTVLTMTVPGSGGQQVAVSAAELGIDDSYLQQVAALGAKISDRLGLVERPGQPVMVVWCAPDGRAGWFRERRRKLRWARVTKGRRGFSIERLSADNRFVNPYSFAPLPEKVTRCAPRGHASMAEEGLSGWFDVSYRFVSDYLLPQDHPGLPALGAPLTIPGSSFKGAVRAIHEVLADGCLRVFRGGLLPVHREVSVNHREWTLAVVDEVDPVTGVVAQVIPCDQVIVIRSDHLLRHVPAAEVYSGLRLDLDVAAVGGLEFAIDTSDPKRIPPLMPEVGISRDGDWVIHLTDAKARSTDRPYYVAAGRVTTAQRPVDPGAWERFRDLAHGGADAVKARHDATPPTFQASPDTDGWPGYEVVFPPENGPDSGRVIGRRRATDGWLSKGDTVWVDIKRGPVTRIKPALLWRTQGEHKAGERVDSSLHPCTDPAELCASCAVFGSAEIQDVTAPRGSRNRDRESQQSYGSHVRFGRLVSDRPVTSRSVDLPPLATPKPSSGMFYLRHDHLTDAPLGNGKDPLAAQRPPGSSWGSALDGGSRPRRLAGRKFYWHGGQIDPHPRGVRRKENAGTQTRSGHLIPAGATVTGRVWFDNLSETQLGYLLAAVEPGLVLHDVDGGATSADRKPILENRAFAVHLGGGRSLGYGTAVPEIVEESLVVHTARSRYAGAAAPTSGVRDYVSIARRDRLGPDETPADAPEPWSALASILDQDRVPADRIWYPPARRWSQRTTGSRQAFNPAFDESYTFFSRYRGGGMGDLTRMQPMQPLPAATDPDQTLPIPGRRP